MSHSRTFLSRSALTAGIVVALFLLGCEESHLVWREQRLPSGKQVKVTSLHLAWGAEHDQRFPDQDCFALQFVTTQPDAAAKDREREAWEVFELIRPASEQWGFKSATLSAFQTPRRERQYDLFIFKRGEDGKWSCTPSDLGRR